MPFSSECMTNKENIAEAQSNGHENRALAGMMISLYKSLEAIAGRYEKRSY